MKVVSVNASENYNVLIGTNLIGQIGAYIYEIAPKASIAIISDTNVWSHYGQVLTQSILDYGMHVTHFVFPAGEASKNMNTYMDILNFLAENKLSRSDAIVALGGGVVGDITGFAAATYLRGISYIQVPTTLLAMVDSSVGGKTAIDLPAGKNLVGAFKQPRLVLCDVDTLKTLPTRLFLDGCAEVIKYAMLYDPELFEMLLQEGCDFDRESVISRCVSLKRDVVQEDEFDNGARQMLNFGHTIGHSIEAKSHFEISHGQAVAAGMAIATKAAVNQGICPCHVYNKLINLLKRFQLPVTTTFSVETLFTSALSDKKRSGSTVNIIVPENIGICKVLPISVSKLEDFIKAGL